MNFLSKNSSDLKENYIKRVYIAIKITYSINAKTLIKDVKLDIKKILNIFYI